MSSANSGSITFNKAHQRGHLPALHGLRGLAALWVVVFHLSAFIPSVRISVNWLPGVLGQIADNVVFSAGWCGVYLFFVLSGYLLGGQLWDGRGKSIKGFYIRRFMRIYPAVWWQLCIALMVFLMFKGWSTAFVLPETFSWQWLFSQASLLLEFSPWPAAAINGVWWTLPVELSFYLMLPLLVWLLRQVPAGYFLIVSVFISMSWRWWFIESGDLENYLPLLKYLSALPGCLCIFCAGMLAARYKQILNHASLLWLLVPLLGFCILLLDLFVWRSGQYWTSAWMQIYWAPMFGVFTAIVVGLLADKGGLLSTKLAWYFGERSYSIYLWHFPLIVLISSQQQWHDLAQVTLIGVLTLVFSEVSYRLVEKPAMKLARKMSMAPVSRNGG